MAPALGLLITLTSPLMWLNSNKFPSITKLTVKLLFFLSLTLLIMNFYNPSWTINFSLYWLTHDASWIPFSFQLDMYSATFVTVALFVMWNILEFSIWYMKEDPAINTFMKYLLIFLITMVILVSANNLLTLFIGWEGVGIMSYLLIGWYHTRNLAATAAIQAVLYNRVGDIGFLMALCWMLNNFSSTNLKLPFHLVDAPMMILLAFIAAAASKSAQFGLHPWLAAAMEGPTPVSALLHSSTMVVAGIFLLVRIHPLISNNQTALTMCLCLGAMSTMYASASALTQNDIKKIIAHSTSSQLGLMMVAIGIDQPYLAFLHICTHAFFKAMLFMCSGLFIHALNDEQDIRKMGGLYHLFPISTSCFTIGSLALMGTPFMSAFFSKDAIIESINNSQVNLTALLLTLMATAFTAVYTVRLVYFMSVSNTRTTNTCTPITESSMNQATKPIVRLAYGSIIAGFLIFFTLIPNNPITHTMPVTSKLTAILTTITAFIIAFDLAKLTWTSKPLKSLNLFSMTTFFSQVTHRWLSQSTMSIAEQSINFLVESFFLKKAVTNLLKTQSSPIRATLTSQSGLIKAYLTTLLISTLIAVTLLY